MVKCFSPQASLTPYGGPDLVIRAPTRIGEARGNPLAGMLALDLAMRMQSIFQTESIRGKCKVHLFSRLK